MPKKLCQFVVMFLCIPALKIQAVTFPIGISVNNKLTKTFKIAWLDKVTSKGVKSQSVKNVYADANSSQYFSDVYKYANIFLAKGRVFRNVKMRIDMVSQETYFLSANGVEGLIEKGMVKEIIYADTTDLGIIQYRFKTGFALVDNQTQDNFYLVLAEGKCSFLKSISKKVTERKNDLTNEILKEFETYENYYFYTNGEMKRWKKDKDFVLAQLADKKTQVEQFLLANKTNFRNIESVARLLNYYNSL